MLFLVLALAVIVVHGGGTCGTIADLSDVDERTTMKAMTIFMPGPPGMDVAIVDSTVCDGTIVKCAIVGGGCHIVELNNAV
jgi:hypothetical protein